MILLICWEILLLLREEIDNKWVRDGCHHSSVDSSAPSILQSQVWVPSTPSKLSSIYICFESFGKYKNEHKKRPGLDHTKLMSKRGREGPNSRIPDRRENMKLSDSFIGSFLVSQNLMMGKKIQKIGWWRTEMKWRNGF